MFLKFFPSVPARRLLLLSFLLILASASVRAQFSLSDLEAGPRLGFKRDPHIARVDEGYVVVWGESLTTDPLPGWIGASLAGTDGRILRTFEPVRWQQGLPQFPGTIAAGGDRVAVPGLCISPAGVRSVCVTWLNLRDGSISQPQLIEEDAVHPSMAWNGRSFLLTYVSRPFHERELRARIVSPERFAGQPITIGRWYSSSHVPSVRAAGESFFVAWHSSPTSSTLAEVSNGMLHDSVPLDAPLDPSGVVPHLSLNSFEGELIVVTGLGSVRRYRDLLPLTPWMTLGRSRHEIFHPRAVRTANGWSIVFADAGSGGEVRAVAVRSDGTFSEEVRLGAALRSFGSFDTAASDSGFVLTWVRDRHPEPVWPPESDVVLRAFDSKHDPVRDARIISLGVASQASPVAAFGGGAYLVAWSERRGELWQVRARRLASDGQPLGPPIELPISETDQIHPAIEFNGESFLLIWSEGSGGRGGIRGARIDSQGSVLDPAGIRIAGEIMLPYNVQRVPARVADLAWSGSSWIIASEEQEGIGLRRLAANGLLLDSAARVLPRTGELQRMPVIDCAVGGNCLVAWQTYIRWGCQFTCPTWPDSVVALRLTSDLELLAESPLLLTEPQSGTLFLPRNLAVSWNEVQRSWLVAWAGPSGRRISAAGIPLDPPGGDSWWGAFPSMISDGDGWRVLWREAALERTGLFVAWTATGFRDSAFLNRILVAPANQALETSLTAGPMPLALFVQAVPELGGTRRIFGKFLDERHPVARRRAVGRR